MLWAVSIASLTATSKVHSDIKLTVKFIQDMAQSITKPLLEH